MSLRPTYVSKAGFILVFVIVDVSIRKVPLDFGTYSHSEYPRED